MSNNTEIILMQGCIMQRQWLIGQHFEPRYLKIQHLNIYMERYVSQCT